MTQPGFIALFPGQGAQQVGMGKELSENFRIAKETMEEVSDAIHVNLAKLCFDGPESDLTLTENTQPCLLTVSIAAFRVAQSELGFVPKAAAGHSLGEYAALVAAGSLDLPTAAAWVRARGAAMQRAVPAGQGTMAAVIGLEDAAVEELCRAATAGALEKRAQGLQPEEQDLDIEAIVEPANFNGPGQVVVAGSSDAVAELVATAKTDPRFSKSKVMPLSVSAPFHCRLMAPARQRMAEIFSEAKSGQRPRPLACPYVPNRTGRMTREENLVLEFLVDQMDHPVLWRQSMQAFLESGLIEGVEFGPGRVLQGLAKRMTPIENRKLTVTGLGDLATLKALETRFKPGVSNS